MARDGPTHTHTHTKTTVHNAIMKKEGGSGVGRAEGNVHTRQAHHWAAFGLGKGSGSFWISTGQRQRQFEFG